MSKSSGGLKAKRLFQPNLTRTRKWVRKHDMLLIGAGGISHLMLKRVQQKTKEEGKSFKKCETRKWDGKHDML